MHLLLTATIAKDSPKSQYQAGDTKEQVPGISSSCLHRIIVLTHYYLSKGIFISKMKTKGISKCSIINNF